MAVDLFVSSISRALTSPVLKYSRSIFASNSKNLSMGHQDLSLISKRRHANFRLCNIAGYVTDLLEIHADKPTLHVLFVPGNPGIDCPTRSSTTARHFIVHQYLQPCSGKKAGVVSFYTDFLESLYDFLGATASVTAIGHISHTKENREDGKLFTLREQVDHKVHFMDNELRNIDVPLILVGHSIGAYICMEMFRKSPEKVIYCMGLYPFLAVNTKSSTQSFIKEITASPFISAMLSSIVAFLGFLPMQVSRFLVRNSVGKPWSDSAVEVLCVDVLKYHTVRNMLFMAMTEFKKLEEKPDWEFMRENKGKIGFLFGLDDHWGPLQLLEEISKELPEVSLAIEREGYTHAFSCTDGGSLWVARHVATTLLHNTITESPLK